MKYSDTMEIKIQLLRHDSVDLSFSKSEYVRSDRLSYGLGSNFLDFDQPDWWSRVQAQLEKDQSEFLAEGHEPSFLKVPPVEWLKKNVRRTIDVVYAVKISLPTGGVLQRRVSKEDYDDFRERYPNGDERYPKLDPKHIVSETGENVFTIWNVFESHKNKENYHLEFRKARRALEGQLLFEYADENTYMVIQLPPEFLEMQEGLMPRGFNRDFMAKAVIYKVAK